MPKKAAARDKAGCILKEYSVRKQPLRRGADLCQGVENREMSSSFTCDGDSLSLYLYFARKSRFINKVVSNDEIRLLRSELQ